MAHGVVVRECLWVEERDQPPEAVGLALARRWLPPVIQVMAP